MFDRPGHMSYGGALVIKGRDYQLKQCSLRLAYAQELGRADQLTVLDVKMLASLLGVELCRRNRRIAGGRAKGTQMEVGAIRVDSYEDCVASALICVECSDHVSREAIGLNLDCSIDIAEWADERDAMPFLRALDAWVDEVGSELFWQRMHGGGRDE